jgi:hypothetical protein
LTQSQPPITRTTHTLPFDKLSPRDFERLCLWLVQREGYSGARHLQRTVVTKDGSANDLSQHKQRTSEVPGTFSPLQYPMTTFVEGVNGTTVGAFSKSTCYQDGRVYLDTSQRKRSSYFDGVPEEVWDFHIGGYQVCHKWLYDRRGTRGEPGCTLTADDIAHYQRIVVALKETIRLMEQIDEVIERHGGWPIK